MLACSLFAICLAADPSRDLQLPNNNDDNNNDNTNNNDSNNSNNDSNNSNNNDNNTAATPTAHRPTEGVRYKRFQEKITFT